MHCISNPVPRPVSFILLDVYLVVVKLECKKNRQSLSNFLKSFLL